MTSGSVTPVSHATVEYDTLMPVVLVTWVVPVYTRNFNGTVLPALTRLYNLVAPGAVMSTGL